MLLKRAIRHVLLRRALGAAAASLVVCVCPSAMAGPAPAPAPAPSKTTVGDVLGFPFRWLGGQIVSGGVDKLKGAADATIQDVDTRLTKQETQVAGLASDLLANAQGKVDDTLDHVDHILDASILQIKTVADDTVDRAMGEVNATLRDRIDQLGAVGSKLVTEAGKTVDDALDKANALLKERSDDIDQMADDLVTHADQAVKDRIDQIDEAAGRRLGDVDVIAAKQRIEIEETALHLAVLLGLVGFLGFALRALWRDYDGMTGELQGVRGTDRTALLLRRLAPALLLRVGGAAAGAALLGGLYVWLPMGAQQEAAALAALHEKQLDESVARMDCTQAKFQASELQYLKPEEAMLASGKAEKAGLLRDLVARPALLATKEAIAAFETRVGSVERALGPRPDPDLLVMRAIVAWESGASRVEEHRAASLAARALELGSRGFALSPLARAYVATFLETPYLPSAPEEQEVGRDTATYDELEDSLAAGPPDPPRSPFAPIATLARLTRRLDHDSTAAYTRMVESQAAIAVLTRDPSAPPDPKALAAAVAERTAQAGAVVNAWNAFDAALGDTPGLDGPLVLAVFRLNDAVLTRARWYLSQPQTAASCEPLAQLAAPPGVRLQLAPARIAWARRYDSLFRGPARRVAQLEEAQRFHAWEQWTLEFEKAVIAEALARAKGGADGAERWRVVVAASALGLYVGEGRDRLPYARVVAGDLRSPLDPTATRKRTPDAPVDLAGALRVRGPRLI